MQKVKITVLAFPALFKMALKKISHLRTQTPTANFVTDDVQEQLLTKFFIWNFHYAGFG